MSKYLTRVENRKCGCEIWPIQQIGWNRLITIPKRHNCKRKHKDTIFQDSIIKRKENKVNSKKKQPLNNVISVLKNLNQLNNFIQQVDQLVSFKINILQRLKNF